MNLYINFIILLICLTFTFESNALVTATPSSDFSETLKSCRQNSHGWPPLVYATSIQRWDVVQFLITAGEDIDARTPDEPLYYEGGYNFNTYRHSSNVIGYTSLDYAIDLQDLELVTILTSYHPTRRANVETSVTRWLDLSRCGSGWMLESYRTQTTSPLQDALALSDIEMAAIILKAYKTPKILFETYATVRSTLEPELMSVWVEQNTRLSNKASYTPTEEETACLIAYNLLESVQLGFHDQVAVHLKCGWMVSKEEFTAILNSCDDVLIEKVAQHGRYQEGFYPEDLLIEAGYAPLAATHFSDCMIEACVRQNQLDLFVDLLPTCDYERQLRCFDLAVQHHSYDVLSFLLEQGLYHEEALIMSVSDQDIEGINLLIQGMPISENTLEQALKKAYELGRFDIAVIIYKQLSP